ncbi:MAG: hypothetical protein ACYDCN_15550 [Bacteroidia bacterium]
MVGKIKENSSFFYNTVKSSKLAAMKAVDRLWFFNTSSEELSVNNFAVLSPDFSYKVNDVFKEMRLFFNYMSEVLTTDANGGSIL